MKFFYQNYVKKTFFDIMIISNSCIDKLANFTNISLNLKPLTDICPVVDVTEDTTIQYVGVNTSYELKKDTNL